MSDRKNQAMVPTLDADAHPAASGHELAPGTLVDHFKVQRVVGIGGMGEVYLARDTKLGRRVALKLIKTKHSSSDRMREAFQREARTTARFSHPNIVAIYAVGEHEGTPYVALEYVEGENLRERMSRREVGRGEAIRIGLAIAEALREAHRHGVLHRDLKPENVVVGDDGRLRVLDFGLAHQLTPDRADVENDGGVLGRVEGTPQFMAPEQWRAEASSPATDVWALGCMLFELVADRLPFEEESVVAICDAVLSPRVAPRLDDALADVPSELADLVAECLAKDPADRPASKDVAERLETLLPGRRNFSGDDVSPYRGLLPFTERHASLYFGREAEIDAFVERLRFAPVVTVVGPSGSGKTSFLRGGVIPRLHERERWVVAIVRPGADPFRALAARLTALGRSSSTSTGADSSSATVSVPAPSGSPDEVSDLAEALSREPGRIALALRALAEDRGANVLLYVDQLEELMTVCEDPNVQRRFLDGVFAAADDTHDPIRVVLTLRDDFLGRLATSPVARAALQNVSVLERPSHASLERMISGPAETAGYTFDDETLPAEMADAVVNEPGALPLLSFAAEELWKLRDRKGKRLLRTAYEKIGGVEGAIAAHAGGVLGALSSADVPVTRDILLRLVTPDRTRRSISRKDALDGLPPRANALLERLVEARLVAVHKPRDGGIGRERLELAHESLVVRWPTLSRWIDESREDLAFAAEVRQAASRWEKRERDPDALWHGDELRDALRIRARMTFDLPESAAQFLAAGRRRASQQSRRRRIVVGSALAILAIASTVLAVLSSRLAEEKRHAEEQRSEAMLEDASSTVQRGRVHEGRAKLRAALEERDSTGVRSLFWRLSRDPLLWRKDIGVATRTVSISPSGDHVVIGCDDGSVRVIDSATGDVEVLRGHTDSIDTVAHSDDGSLVASGDSHGRVLLWNTEEGGRPRALSAGAEVLDLRFVPGTHDLVTAGRDGTVRVWDTGSLQERRVLHRGDPAVWRVDVSRDGRWLAAGDGAGDVFVTTFDGASPPHRIELGAGGINAVEFNHDGSLVAASGRDGLVSLFRTGSWELAGALVGHANKVTDVVFSGDGEVIATTSFDQSVRLWSARTFEATGTFEGHDSYVYAASFGPSGRTIASVAYDRTVQYWRIDRVDGQEVERGHTNRTTSIAFSRDGEVVYSGSADHTVRSWDVGDGGERFVFRGHSAEVWGVSVSPDGQLVASGGSDQSVRLWRTGTGMLERVLGGHAGDVDDVEFSPDGTLVASAGADESVRIWDARGIEPSRTLNGHTGMVYRIAFDDAGERLVSAGSDSRVMVWDVTSGDRIGVVNDHDNRVRDARFTSDGRILSGGDDRSARLGGLVAQPRVAFDHPRRVQTVDGRPGSTDIVTGSMDGAVRIWTDGGELLHAMSGHRGLVYMTRYSPDGRLIASVADDGTVRLWDADEGVPVWRTAALLERPVRVLTHRGWTRWDGSAGSGLASDFESALTDRTQFTSTHEDSACLRTFDGRVELWDLRSGESLAAIARSGVRDVRAITGGCVSWSDDRVERLARDGSVTPLPVDDPVHALGEGPELLVATERELVSFSIGGARRVEAAVDLGATAVTRRDDASFIVGYRDGSVDVVAATGAAETGTRTFEGHPASAVRRIVVGPRDTVLVGYDDGYLGMWNLVDGRQLGHARLHGPVVYAVFDEDGFFHAASELGDFVRWDVSAFTRPWCDLVRETWRDTPVVWQDGRVVRAEPPSSHTCR